MWEKYCLVAYESVKEKLYALRKQLPGSNAQGCSEYLCYCDKNDKGTNSLSYIDGPELLCRISRRLFNSIATRMLYDKML